jgi:hypothetical protein
MLEIDNSQIEYIAKKPFYIFKIKNFFNYSFYIDLKNSIPKVEDFSKLLNGNNQKYSIDDDNAEHYQKFLKTNRTIEKFSKMVNSENFFNLFKEELNFSFLKSRITDPISFLKILRPYKYNSLNKDIFDKLYCNVKSKIQYSYIRNSGKIYPHTDGTNKLLTLMLYFPDGLKNEEKIGTIFWKSKIRNFKNKHRETDDELKKFYSNSKKICITPFEENTLYGFIKNSDSWHSVEKINVNENYIRKSININFFI